jgi:hypothetical protein
MASLGSFKITLDVKEKGKNSPNYSLMSDIDGKQTFEENIQFLKSSIISISDVVLREEQNKGFDKEPLLLVDGKSGKSKYDVSPFGSIHYIARANFKDLIMFAYNAIISRSKEVTGRYFNHNLVVYNGRTIASNPVQLEAWLKDTTYFNDADYLRFVNTVPYARKLEYLGISKGRRVAKTRKPKKSDKVKAGTRLKTPNGAYTLAYRAIKRKYKKNVKRMSFQFIPGNLLGLMGSGREFVNDGRPYLYPSILITLSDKGVIASKTEGGR